MTDDASGPAISDDFVQVPDDFVASEEFGVAQDRSGLNRPLMAWHRPRKQYVRRNQWANSLRELMSRVGSFDTVSYLGLPGDEFLDIRYLAEGPVAEAGVRVRFLGFNNSAAARAENALSAEGPSSVEQLSALEETRNSPHVDRSSDIQPDDVRSICRDRSPAKLRTKEFGPFDVVNFDLTQSIFASPHSSDSYKDALRSIIGMQAKYAKHEWLLWVTTRVDRQAVDMVEARELLRLLKARQSQCIDVVEDVRCRLEAAVLDDLEMESCSEQDFQTVVLLGLCVWLYGLGVGPNPQKTKLISCFSYRIADGDGPSDMVSLVLRMTPQDVDADDPSGITRVRPAPSVPNPCAQWGHILGRHQHVVDVRVALREDAELKRELILETADLLERIHIDRDEYLEWIEQFAD